MIDTDFSNRSLMYLFELFGGPWPTWDMSYKPPKSKNIIFWKIQNCYQWPHSASEKNKTRGLQLCPVFHFTTQWFSNPRCGQNMTTLLPKHGPHMVLQMGSSWILIDVPRDAQCQLSLCWLNSVAPFPRNGHNVALLWRKHGPQMVLQISFPWILINVSMYAPCQIWQFWGYPLVPFS